MIEYFKKTPPAVEAMKVDFTHLAELVIWTKARVSFDSSNGDVVEFVFFWADSGMEIFAPEGTYLVKDPDLGWTVVNENDMHAKYIPIDKPSEEIEYPEDPEDPEDPTEYDPEA